MLGTYPALAAPVERASLAPVGLQVLCQRTPGLCHSTQPATLRFDQTASDLLNKVNVAINRRIRIRPDEPGTDVWSLGVSAGDCEDYVLAKRVALIRSGVPAGAVRIARAVTSNGIGHAVIIIKSSIGDLALDNRTNVILLAHETALTFLNESSPHLGLWHKYTGRAH